MYKFATIISLLLILDGALMVLLTFESNMNMTTSAISLDSAAAQLKNGDNFEAVDKFRQDLSYSMNRGKKGLDKIGIIGMCFAGTGILSLILTGVFFMTKRKKINHN